MDSMNLLPESEQQLHGWTPPATLPGWCQTCSLNIPLGLADGRLRLLAELDGYRYLYCHDCDTGLIVPPDASADPSCTVELIEQLTELATGHAIKLKLATLAEAN